MQKQLLLKCITLVLLGLGLMIPLSMIESTITERNFFRMEAVRKVAANTAGAQTVVGPIVVIPVEEEVEETRIDPTDATKPPRQIRTIHKRDLLLYPQKLNLEGALAVENRAYGLHQVAVYEFQGALSGSFDPPAESDLPGPRKNGVMRWGKPKLVVGLGDSRGIVAEPHILLGDAEIKASRGTGLDMLSGGFQAEIPFAVHGLTKRLPFRIDLKLAGTESFGVIPLADQTTAKLSSNWINPSFGGGFLPRSREVNEKGFSAQWSVSALAANVQESLMTRNQRHIVGQPVVGSLEDMNSFRVNLIDPVDIYHQSVRAAKYGVLFIAITFAAFFLFESVRSLPIHPIQYALVGLALALFFLLLMSLSEHISFAWAYAVASAACVGLITSYLAAALRGWRRGLGFGGGLGLLFGFLFGVLASEQNALLLGALLLFGVLAGLMTATRKVDWYRLKSAGEQTP